MAEDTPQEPNQQDAPEEGGQEAEAPAEQFAPDELEASPGKTAPAGAW